MIVVCSSAGSPSCVQSGKPPTMSMSWSVTTKMLVSILTIRGDEHVVLARVVGRRVYRILDKGIAARGITAYRVDIKRECL